MLTSDAGSVFHRFDLAGCFLCTQKTAEAKGAQLVHSTGGEFLLPLPGSFEAHHHHSFAAGTFRCHWIKFFANPPVAAWFGKLMDQVCCWWWRDCSARKLYFHRWGDGHGVFGSIFCWKKATVLSPFHPAHWGFNFSSWGRFQNDPWVRAWNKSMNQWMETKETLMLTLKMQKRRRTTYPQKEKVRFDVFFY